MCAFYLNNELLINSKYFRTPFRTPFVYLRHQVENNPICTRTMKHTVKFTLRNNNAKAFSAINLIVFWGYKENGKPKPFKYTTGEKVNPEQWEGQRAKGPYSAGVNTKLVTIGNEVNKIFNRLQDEQITPDILRGELDIALGRSNPKPVPVKKKQFIADYITRYIDDIETGKRRNSRNPVKRFAPGTIRNFRAFKTKFSEYETARGKRFTFDHIDMKFYRHFIAWLDQSHTINTTGKTIKQLKMIMQAALDDDVHTNVEFKKKRFMVVSELVDAIYLTADEINILCNYDAKGPHKKARDLFVVGTLSAQRVSDWHQVNEKNIKLSPNGTKIISFKQKKTGTPVVIPFTDSRLLAIMREYDNELPKMPDQKINKYIKVVCRLAGITDKADQVTTHTARRSGCSNMYYAGLPIGKIMKVSGHKTESEFKKYIRVTDEENAEDLATHKYFSQ